MKIAGVEPYRPFPIEDPVPHENPRALAHLRAHTGLPLATGERYQDKWDFRDRRACSIGLGLPGIVAPYSRMDGGCLTIFRVISCPDAGDGPCTCA